MTMDVNEAWSRDESCSVDDVVAIRYRNGFRDIGDDAVVDENVCFRQIDIR